MWLTLSQTLKTSSHLLKSGKYYFKLLVEFTCSLCVCVGFHQLLRGSSHSPNLLASDSKLVLGVNVRVCGGGVCFCVRPVLSAGYIWDELQLLS